MILWMLGIERLSNTRKVLCLLGWLELGMSHGSATPLRGDPTAVGTGHQILKTASYALLVWDLQFIDVA